MNIIKQFNFYRREILIGLCVVFSCHVSYGGYNGCHIRFADKIEANKVLATSDRYIERLGEFDLEVRVGIKNATRQDLLNMIKKETREFTVAERDSVIKAFSIFSDAVERRNLKLPVPKELLLIKTTMNEEGGAAAYTRGDVICLGEKLLKKADTKKLAKLLAHEMFHVMTRYSIDFRKTMYEIIGFEILNKEICFANDISKRFISNPDVNSNDAFVMLNVDGRLRPFTMVIFSNMDYAGGSFFDYVNIGLIPLDKTYSPLVHAGRTVIYDLDDVPDFYNKVGRNTGYVINPEECLADNFSMALFSLEKELPNPEIINKIVLAIQKMNVN